MKLKEYFDTYNVNVIEFAYKCHISAASIWLYFRGRKPHQSTAETIEQVSGGKVTVTDLRGKDDRLITLRDAKRKKKNQ